MAAWYPDGLDLQLDLIHRNQGGEVGEQRQPVDRERGHIELGQLGASRQARELCPGAHLLDGRGAYKVDVFRQTQDAELGQSPNMGESRWLDCLARERGQGTRVRNEIERKMLERGQRQGSEGRGAKFAQLLLAEDVPTGLVQGGPTGLLHLHRPSAPEFQFDQPGHRREPIGVDVGAKANVEGARQVHGPISEAISEEARQISLIHPQSLVAAAAFVRQVVVREVVAVGELGVAIPVNSRPSHVVVGAVPPALAHAVHHAEVQEAEPVEHAAQNESRMAQPGRRGTGQREGEAKVGGMGVQLLDERARQEWVGEGNVEEIEELCARGNRHAIPEVVHPDANKVHWEITFKELIKGSLKMATTTAAESVMTFVENFTL